MSVSFDCTDEAYLSFREWNADAFARGRERFLAATKRKRDRDETTDLFGEPEDRQALEVTRIPFNSVMHVMCAECKQFDHPVAMFFGTVNGVRSFRHKALLMKDNVQVCPPVHGKIRSYKNNN